VELRYGKSNGWLDGQPAMLTRALGKGSITYLGTLPDAALMHALMETAATNAGVHAAFGPVPVGVEVCRRVGTDRVVYIVINHGRSPAHVDLPGRMHETLTNRDLTTVELPTQGVAVLIAEGR
jgi:beta-galactosidase